MNDREIFIDEYIHNLKLELLKKTKNVPEDFNGIHIRLILEQLIKENLTAINKRRYSRYVKEVHKFLRGGFDEG